MSGIVVLSLRILAGAALYAFLGGVFFFLWRSLKQETMILASRQVIPMDLLVCAPGEEEKTFHFSKSNIAIGRDPDCECVLSHSTVSAQHARLSFHHTQWWLDDLLSTNGTKLNNEPLQMPTVVVNGDTIKCGQVEITVILKSDENPAEGVNE